MHFHITPYLRKKPTNIICHVGTNNAKSDTSDEIMVKLVKLKEYILSKCPSTNLVFSSLIDRIDDPKAGRVVQETNEKLAHLNVPLLINHKINNEHLGKKGLHLNRSGVVRFAMNIIDTLKSFND